MIKPVHGLFSRELQILEFKHCFQNNPFIFFLVDALFSQDCPPEAGEFRAQQCSAHNDVKYQGQYYEWLPVYNDPEKPCALKCLAKGTSLIVELAPKVLDGTRCYTETLHMCISGNCQVSNQSAVL